ncbi:hypothetical protein ACN47E_006038 [Coniothyrium glycines]
MLPESEAYIYELNQWLPQMLAFHHPAKQSLEPTTFLRIQQNLLTSSSFSHELTRLHVTHQRSSSGNNLTTTTVLMPRGFRSDFMHVNFIIAYLALSQMIYHRGDQGLLARDFAQALYPEPEASENSSSSTAAKMFERVLATVRFRRGFSLEQALAVLPALIVQYDEQGLSRDTAILPNPDAMSFNSFMDLPKVFSDDPAFGVCHIRKMNTASFLSGQWLGIYTDQRWEIGRDQIDPPMRNINLVCRRPAEEDSIEEQDTNVSVLIDEESQGIDSHGYFSLKGWIRLDGAVFLSKNYFAAGFSWSWLGQLTPFGIVGAWGDGDIFGGHFWIWKKEWLTPGDLA